MPAGSPFEGRILPYHRIRVDTFLDVKDQQFSPPRTHLLTHAHCDHTPGLVSFRKPLICSADTKQILLRLETRSNRINANEGKAQRRRTYTVLAPPSNSWDYLQSRNLNESFIEELEDGLKVRITLIDANHCPGSVMYLVEGKEGAVLHTGDIRVDAPHLDRLRQHRVLNKYAASGPRVLDAIYMDTASIFGANDLPSKADGIEDTLSLLEAYPTDRVFFVNAWTWGYEDLLKAIARRFHCKVHTDQYKGGVYSQLSDEELRSCIANEKGADSTRFHACERDLTCRSICKHPRLVYVNPTSKSRSKWKEYIAETREGFARGIFPDFLEANVARHSCLSELQAFVAAFRPKKVVPNDLVPSLKGWDWFSMLSAFGPHIMEGGIQEMEMDLDKHFPRRGQEPPKDTSNLSEEVEISIENFIRPESVEESEDARLLRAQKGALLRRSRLLNLIDRSYAALGKAGTSGGTNQAQNPLSTKTLPLESKAAKRGVKRRRTHSISLGGEDDDLSSSLQQALSLTPRTHDVHSQPLAKIDTNRSRPRKRPIIGFCVRKEETQLFHHTGVAPQDADGSMVIPESTTLADVSLSSHVWDESSKLASELERKEEGVDFEIKTPPPKRTKLTPQSTQTLAPKTSLPLRLAFASYMDSG